MLKATAGGGGMGLQICNEPSEIASAFASVEARGATLFKNTSMFMEKYVAKSRHVEVQVFGNGMGGAVDFGERECSIQRRHQKVVEECPSPFVNGRPGESERRTASNNDRHARGTHELCCELGEQRSILECGYCRVSALRWKELTLDSWLTI
jgi:acetyl/propionyl-CoA carboxylase alpha subunit